VAGRDLAADTDDHGRAGGDDEQHERRELGLQATGPRGVVAHRRDAVTEAARLMRLEGERLDLGDRSDVFGRNLGDRRRGAGARSRRRLDRQCVAQDDDHTARSMAAG
jgi:hypothetical protein